MKKLSVCILFGGMSPEHEVSLRSAESVLNHIDESKYNLFPVGITKEGDWILYGGKDYSKLVTGEWRSCPENRRATISPVRGQGLLSFEGDCVVRERIDVVFPVLHGENGEDGAMQGLLQMAGIPYVGPHIAASAVAMDKSLTKLVADQAGVPQAAWQLVRAGELENHMENTLDLLSQDQSDAARQTEALTVEATARKTEIAALEAERRSAEENVQRLESLRAAMEGDRAQKTTLLEAYQADAHRMQQEMEQVARERGENGEQTAQKRGVLQEALASRART